MDLAIKIIGADNSTRLRIEKLLGQLVEEGVIKDAGVSSGAIGSCGSQMQLVFTALCH